MATTKTKLVKVNADDTVSFLTVGKPANGTIILTVSGEYLEALKAGKTVKVSKRSNSGFSIQA